MSLFSVPSVAKNVNESETAPKSNITAAGRRISIQKTTFIIKKLISKQKSCFAAKDLSSWTGLGRSGSFEKKVLFF